MSVPTLTLTDFLLARIAEGEEDARRLQAAYEADEVKASASVINAGALVIPARALAECEAKRQVVDAYRGLWEVAKAAARAGRDEEANVARNMYAGVELAMQALALPYASHPDYREQWRP